MGGSRRKKIGEIGRGGPFTCWTNEKGLATSEANGQSPLGEEEIQEEPIILKIENKAEEPPCGYLDEWTEYIYPKEVDKETPPKFLGEFLEEEIVVDYDEGWKELEYIEEENNLEEIGFLSLQTPKEKEEAKRRASSQGSGMRKSYPIAKLKALSDPLSYKCLGKNSTYPVIVSSCYIVLN